MAYRTTAYTTVRTSIVTGRGRNVAENDNMVARLPSLLVTP